jgi:hypothetical protein
MMIPQEKINKFWELRISTYSESRLRDVWPGLSVSVVMLFLVMLYSGFETWVVRFGLWSGGICILLTPVIVLFIKRTSKRGNRHPFRYHHKALLFSLLNLEFLFLIEVYCLSLGLFSAGKLLGFPLVIRFSLILFTIFGFVMIISAPFYFRKINLDRVDDPMVLKRNLVLASVAGLLPPASFLLYRFVSHSGQGVSIHVIMTCLTYPISVFLFILIMLTISQLAILFFSKWPAVERVGSRLIVEANNEEL